MKRYPVAAFYLLAFLISWLGWWPQTLTNQGRISVSNPLLTLLGGGGPTLAAVLVLLFSQQREQVPLLFKALFRWRTAPLLVLFVLAFWPALAILALTIGRLLGQPMPSAALLPWQALVPVFVTMLLSNVWEEIGWRGFALPRLQQKYPDGLIALLMGLLWSLWHLPLLLDPLSPMSGLPWYGEILFNLALTVIYTWLYRQTNGSLLYVSLFHAMSNTSAFLLLQAQAFTSTYLYVVGLTCLAALVILAVYGVRRFERGRAVS